MRVLALWMACVAVSASAAPEAGSPPTLTWADVEVLLADHPLSVTATATVEVAEGEALSARGLPNPEVELGVGYATPREEGDGMAVWGMDAGWSVPWPGVVEGRVSGSRARLRAAQADRHLADRGVWLTARTLFLTLAHDQTVALLWGEAVTQAEELQRLVQVRVDRGEDRPMEALRATTELERTRMEAERAALQWQLGREALGRWLGAQLPGEFLVNANLGSWPGLPAREEVARRVRAEHPSLLAATARLDGASADLRLAHAEAVPELSVGGFYEEELDLSAAGGVVGLEIPLGSPGVGEVARARAEKRIGEQELELASRELDLVVDEAWTGYQTALMAATRYRDGILPSASRAMELSNLAYRAGEVSLLEVLDAYRVLLDVRVEEADAQLQLQLSIEEIRALMGETDETN